MDSQSRDVVECAVDDDQDLWYSDSDTESQPHHPQPLSFARCDTRPQLTSRPSLLTRALQHQCSSIKQDQPLATQVILTDHGRSHINDHGISISAGDAKTNTTKSHPNSDQVRRCSAVSLSAKDVQKEMIRKELGVDQLRNHILRHRKSHRPVKAKNVEGQDLTPDRSDETPAPQAHPELSQSYYGHPSYW